MNLLFFIIKGVMTLTDYLLYAFLLSGFYTKSNQLKPLDAWLGGESVA